MKNTLLFICLSFMFWACHGSNNDKITITINVDKMPKLGMGISYMVGIQRMVELDENGHGMLEIEGLDAVYFKVHNGFDEIVDLYAEKGDNINLSFDGVSMKNTLKIEGDKKKITEYLKNKKPLEKMPNETFLLEFPEFLKKVDQFLAADLESFINEKEELEQASKLFAKLEENNIKLDRYLDILHYPAVQRRIKKSSETVFPDGYFDELKRQMIEDPDLLSLPAYRTMMTENALRIATEGKGSADEHAKVSSQVGYIASNIKEKEVREKLIDILICDYTKQHGIDKALDEFYRKNVTDKELADGYKKIYDSWMRVEPGQPMIDFKAVSPNGEIVTPNKFKGQPTCYYLWQSFYPAIREYQFLKELESVFAEKNIKFVALSFDTNKESWEQSRQSQEVQFGEHYYLGYNKEFLDACHYDSYKMYQFILVDTQGSIITIKMPFPSSGKFAEYIESKL